MLLARASLLALAFPLVAACGGATCPCQCPAESPTTTRPDPAPESVSASEPEPEPETASGPTPHAPEPAAKTPEKPATPVIDFPANATVEQAIAAVPQGLPRLNMSQDALDGPLVDPAKYSPCNVPASVHFKVHAAVFDGKAVGVDVETKPRNKRLDACIADVVRSMTWQKVASLNTVTASF